MKLTPQPRDHFAAPDLLTKIRHLKQRPTCALPPFTTLFLGHKVHVRLDRKGFSEFRRALALQKDHERSVTRRVNRVTTHVVVTIRRTFTAASCIGGLHFAVPGRGRVGHVPFVMQFLHHLPSQMSHWVAVPLGAQLRRHGWVRKVTLHRHTEECRGDQVFDFDVSSATPNPLKSHSRTPWTETAGELSWYGFRQGPWASLRRGRFAHSHEDPLCQGCRIIL